MSTPGASSSSSPSPVAAPAAACPHCHRAYEGPSNADQPPPSYREALRSASVPASTRVAPPRPTISNRQDSSPGATSQSPSGRGRSGSRRADFVYPGGGMGGSMAGAGRSRSRSTSRDPNGNGNTAAVATTLIKTIWSTLRPNKDIGTVEEEEEIRGRSEFVRPGGGIGGRRSRGEVVAIRDHSV